jgi:thiol-disulfide isomerase/thioredoxin
MRPSPKHLLLAGFLFMATSAIAQNFELQFTPPKDLTVTKYYLDRIADNKLVRDSALLKDGKLRFSGNVDYPEKANLVLLLPAVDGKRPEAKFVDVLLEPSKIVVDAGSGLDAVSYSGSKTQSQYAEIKTSLAPLYKKLNLVWAAVYKAQKEEDKEGENKLRSEAKALGEQVKKVREEFMETNSQSPVTAMMLEEYVTPVWENLEKASFYYNRLSPELKALPQMVKFSEGLSIALTMAPGKKYPALVLPDSTGKMIDLSSYKGKYVFVDYWASWCTPCRAESPALVSAYKKYNLKGFEILSISFDQDTKAWLKAVAKDGYTWANAVDTTGMGPKGVTSSRLNIKAIPRNFLLDKEGKVIASNLRGEALENKLRELFGS